MKFRETPQNALEGALNVNVIVEDNHGRKYLKRFPKNNPDIFKSLAHEYHAVGFTKLGGKFRRRTSDEQKQFLEHAAAMGLKVLPPAYVDEKGLTSYRFFEGAQTLDAFLSHASDDEIAQIVYELFADLKYAHSNGVIYGDRWSKNIIIVPKTLSGDMPRMSQGKARTFQKGLLHIDFDLEISGPAAREFELAQTADCILHALWGETASDTCSLKNSCYRYLCSWLQCSYI